MRKEYKNITYGGISKFSYRDTTQILLPLSLPPPPRDDHIVFILRFNLCVVLYTASYVEAR